MFKQCPFCNTIWETRDDFLRDPSLKIIGYQANFNDLLTGLFLFNHTCTTTLAIRTSAFADLYQGERYTSRLTGTAECPEFCLYKDELRKCPAKCECAYIREIIAVIQNWERAAA